MPISPSSLEVAVERDRWNRERCSADACFDFDCNVFGRWHSQVGPGKRRRGRRLVFEEDRQAVGRVVAIEEVEIDAAAGIEARGRTPFRRSWRRLPVLPVRRRVQRTRRRTLPRWQAAVISFIEVPSHWAAESPGGLNC